MNSIHQIELAIKALQSQRALLGDEAIETAIKALRSQITVEESSESSTVYLTGERKLVTIMFVHIFGLNQLSERYEPEILRSIINTCLDSLVPIINEFGGTVHKFIGEEMMVLFGAPKAHERHAELACSAALEMGKALQEFNVANKTNLELNIGINTGIVIAGGIGWEGKQEYSIVGDAVNWASRLKDVAGNGEIYVGSELYALTNHIFEFNALPPIRLKEKNELIRTWRLQGRKIQPTLQREGALRSQLIGRDAELEQLSALMNALKDHKGACMSIIGEAGIGKSRLVTELRKRAELEFIWVEGRSLAYTRQHAYQAVIEVLRKLIAPKINAEGEYLKKLLEEELGETLGEKGKKYLPFLGRMMQLPLTAEEENEMVYLKGAVLRERIFEALAAYISAKSQQRPLILIWEDLHWVDPSSLAVIERLMDLCPSYPLGLALVFRPQKEERIWTLHEQSLQKHPEEYHVFHLAPLHPADSAALARSLMYVENLAPEVEQLIIEKAEGNPFFTEELLRALLDNGMLYQEGRMIKASDDLENMIIPDTLQGVIASRLDQLEETDKQVLQIASILGRIFRGAVLEALLVAIRNYVKLSPVLQRLVNRELLRDRPSEDEDWMSYIFKHAVTHDVTYNSLLAKDRKRLHKFAGETIEQLTEGYQEEYAETLAFHYERSEQLEKALHFLSIAARRAKKLHFNDEAIELYGRALKQAEALQKRDGKTRALNATMATLLEDQGDIMRLMSQIEQAKIVYANTIEKLDTHDWIGRSRILRKTGMCLQAMSQFQAISNYFMQAQQELEQSQMEHTSVWWHEWVEVMNERMFLAYWTNRTEEMQQLILVIEPHLAQANPAQRARYYSNLVLLSYRLERFLLTEESIELSKQAVAACLQSNDLPLTAYTQFILGFSYLWCNQIEESIATFNESLELAEKTGDVVVQTRDLTYLTVAHRRLGEVVQAEYYAHKCIAMAQKINMSEYLGTAMANLAWAAWKKGEIEKVAPLARQAYDYWGKVVQNHSSLLFVWVLAFPFAAYYFQQNDLTACIAQLEIMLQPSRKRLEPALENNINSLIQAYHNSSEGTLVSKQINEVLELAAQYQYL